MSLISRFISEQGKRLSRRVNRLTLKQQRLITIAIKQARIFSLLPFLNNEKQLERSEAIARTIGLRTRNKEAYPSISSKCKSKRSRCFVQKIREPRFYFRVVRIKKNNEGRRINLFFY